MLLCVALGQPVLIGAGALITARTVLAAGGGFDTLMLVLTVAAGLVFLSALLLPARVGAEAVAAPSPAE